MSDEPGWEDMADEALQELFDEEGTYQLGSLLDKLIATYILTALSPYIFGLILILVILLIF